MKQLIGAFLILTAWSIACSSAPDKVRELETELEAPGATPTEAIGVKPDGQAVVQKQVPATASLMTLEHVNENLKLDVRHEFYLLKHCREELALAADSGGREYPELSGFDELQASYQKTVELGLVEGELQVVETSSLAERLEAQRKLQKDLRAVLHTVKEQKNRCLFLQKAQTAH